MPLHHDVDETLGALIARVRAETGLTQLRLAGRLCAAAGVATVTRTEISRWERGERIPRGYWLAWLAVALDVPLSQLERAAAASRRQRRPRADARGRWRELAAGVYERVA